MSQSTLAPRNLKMDNAKFILIVLVVLGHCLERFTPQGINGSLYNAIYTFHMPLFIFITGYFTNTNKDKKKYFEGVFSLFTTFCSFQLIWFVLHRNYTLYYLLTPSWTLWYLLSTIYWKILIYIFRNVNLKLLLGCSVIIALIGGFSTFSAFSIPRTLTFAPFFVLGYIARARSFDFNKLRKAYLLIPSVVLMIGCIIALRGNFSWLLYGSASYLAFHCPLYLAPLLRLSTLIVGCLFSACVLAYAPNHPSLARFGQNTLFYYLYHTFVIIALGMIIGHFHIEKSIPLFMLCTAIVVASLLIAERIPLLRKITEPYKTLKGMRK